MRPTSAVRRPGALLAVLLASGACDMAPVPSDFPPGETDDDSADPADDDSIDPDAWHLLASSDGWNGQTGSALAEVAADGTARWSLGLADGWGVEGFHRFSGGSTLIAKVKPDTAEARLELVDPAGITTWAYDEASAGPLRYAHDVAVTPEGDYVVADTDNHRVIALSPAGALLWTLTALPDGAPMQSPNGVDVRDYGGEGTHVLVSLRSPSPESDWPVAVADYRLVARDQPPEPEWQFPVDPSGGEVGLPHGPRLLADGTRTVCYSALGKVIGITAAGELDFSLPPPEREGSLVTPRDALLVDSQTLWVADSGTGQAMVITDPFGAFVMVSKFLVPGVFRIDRLDCAADATCLPPPR